MGVITQVAANLGTYRFNRIFQCAALIIGEGKLHNALHASGPQYHRDAKEHPEMPNSPSNQAAQGRTRRLSRSTASAISTAASPGV